MIMDQQTPEDGCLKGLPLQEKDVHTLVLTFCHLSSLSRPHFLTFREAWKCLDFHQIFKAHGFAREPEMFLQSLFSACLDALAVPLPPQGNVFPGLQLPKPAGVPPTPATHTPLPPGRGPTPDAATIISKADVPEPIIQANRPPSLPGEEPRSDADPNLTNADVCSTAGHLGLSSSRHTSDAEPQQHISSTKDGLGYDREAGSDHGGTGFLLPFRRLSDPQGLCCSPACPPQTPAEPTAGVQATPDGAMLPQRGALPGPGLGPAEGTPPRSAGPVAVDLAVLLLGSDAEEEVPARPSWEHPGDAPLAPFPESTAFRSSPCGTPFPQLPCPTMVPPLAESWDMASPPTPQCDPNGFPSMSTAFLTEMGAADAFLEGLQEAPCGAPGTDEGTICGANQHLDADPWIHYPGSPNGTRALSPMWVHDEVPLPGFGSPLPCAEPFVEDPSGLVPRDLGLEGLPGGASTSGLTEGVLGSPAVPQSPGCRSQTTSLLGLGERPARSPARPAVPSGVLEGVDMLPETGISAVSGRGPAACADGSAPGLSLQGGTQGLSDTMGQADLGHEANVAYAGGTGGVLQWASPPRSRVVPPLPTASPKGIKSAISLQLRPNSASPLVPLPQGAVPLSPQSEPAQPHWASPVPGAPSVGTESAQASPPQQGILPDQVACPDQQGLMPNQAPCLDGMAQRVVEAPSTVQPDTGSNLATCRDQGPQLPVEAHTAAQQAFGPDLATSTEQSPADGQAGPEEPVLEPFVLQQMGAVYALYTLYRLQPGPRYSRIYMPLRSVELLTKLAQCARTSGVGDVGDVIRWLMSEKAFVVGAASRPLSWGPHAHAGVRGTFHRGAAVDMTERESIVREVVNHLRQVPLQLAGLRHQGLLFETYQRKLRSVWDSMGVPPPQGVADPHLGKKLGRKLAYLKRSAKDVFLRHLGHRVPRAQVPQVPGTDSDSNNDDASERAMEGSADAAEEEEEEDWGALEKAWEEGSSQEGSEDGDELAPVVKGLGLAKGVTAVLQKARKEELTRERRLADWLSRFDAGMRKAHGQTCEDLPPAGRATPHSSSPSPGRSCEPATTVSPVPACATPRSVSPSPGRGCEPATAISPVPARASSEQTALPTGPLGRARGPSQETGCSPCPTRLNLGEISPSGSFSESEFDDDEELVAELQSALASPLASASPAHVLHKAAVLDGLKEAMGQGRRASTGVRSGMGPKKGVANILKDSLDLSQSAAHGVPGTNANATDDACGIHQGSAVHVASPSASLGAAASPSTGTPQAQKGPRCQGGQPDVKRAPGRPPAANSVPIPSNQLPIQRPEATPRVSQPPAASSQQQGRWPLEAARTASPAPPREGGASPAPAPPLLKKTHCIKTAALAKGAAPAPSPHPQHSHRIGAAASPSQAPARSHAGLPLEGAVAAGQAPSPSNQQDSRPLEGAPGSANQHGGPPLPNTSPTGGQGPALPTAPSTEARGSEPAEQAALVEIQPAGPPARQRGKRPPESELDGAGSGPSGRQAAKKKPRTPAKAGSRAVKRLKAAHHRTLVRGASTKDLARSGPPQTGEGAPQQAMCHKSEYPRSAPSCGTAAPGPSVCSLEGLIKRVRSQHLGDSASAKRRCPDAGPCGPQGADRARPVVSDGAQDLPGLGPCHMAGHMGNQGLPSEPSLPSQPGCLHPIPGPTIGPGTLPNLAHGPGPSKSAGPEKLVGPVPWPPQATSKSGASSVPRGRIPSSSFGPLGSQEASADFEAAPTAAQLPARERLATSAIAAAPHPIAEAVPRAVNSTPQETGSLEPVPPNRLRGARPLHAAVSPSLEQGRGGAARVLSAGFVASAPEKQGRQLPGVGINSSPETSRTPGVGEKGKVVSVWDLGDQLAAVLKRRKSQQRRNQSSGPLRVPVPGPAAGRPDASLLAAPATPAGTASGGLSSAATPPSTLAAPRVTVPHPSQAARGRGVAREVGSITKQGQVPPGQIARGSSVSTPVEYGSGAGQQANGKATGPGMEGSGSPALPKAVGEVDNKELKRKIDDFLSGLSEFLD
eukprot:jgi/Botrbrau1/21210/Bobra.39_2s0011.1